MADCPDYELSFTSDKPRISKSASRACRVLVVSFVYGPAGQLLGALGWQSAVAHLGCRDRLLAWSLGQRTRYLDRLVNNVRFLLLPWVKVPCLASVILSEGVRQLERDWPEHYGAPVWWVETFVDRQRFAAISYRASDWQVIGWTRGFAKRSLASVFPIPRSKFSFVCPDLIAVKAWPHATRGCYESQNRTFNFIGVFRDFWKRGLGATFIT